jgi:hypothetical protein
MNLADLFSIMNGYASLTDEEKEALQILCLATPVSITATTAMLMKRGVELVLNVADPLATGVSPLDTEIDTAQSNYASLASTLEVGVTVLIDLVDWPTGQPQTTQIIVTDETDLDEVFPGGWSHALYTQALFENGLPDVWAPHEADPSEIQELQGDTKWVVWQGLIGFLEDGTEDTSYDSTVGQEFRAPTPDDLLNFGLLR